MRPFGVTVDIMRALLSMDQFVLLARYGGIQSIRDTQQKLNREYRAYARPESPAPMRRRARRATGARATPANGTAAGGRASTAGRAWRICAVVSKQSAGT